MFRRIHPFRVARTAFYAFLSHDGWAIASHIALSGLMSLFPFLILVTALAGMFGTRELADEAAKLLLEAWPKEVAGPIAREISTVLTSARSDALTIGAALALYFASSGVESLRIGLNRAYGDVEARSFYILRLESILFVILGAGAMLALALFVVLGPTAIRFLVALQPEFGILWRALNWWRLVIATSLITAALLFAHLWLPAGRRTLVGILPGAILTLGLWLAAGIAFGRYLDDFSQTYVTTYAGLATGMIALVFLYWSATMFLLGAELNAAVAHEKTLIEMEERAEDEDENGVPSETTVEETRTPETASR
ncbi:YihY/virulence factor BrkB family protein [Terrarubrum flagellatum]|uniref:YihY/virulence factor BrkB family protein n=1 Tax=Terrirubrum flagellatum TaxID=2895980 RepID=UPI0031453345